MAGQAARMTRSQVTSMMNKVDISKQKKTGTGGDPVCCPNFYGNPSLGHSGKTMDNNKEIHIKGPKL